MAHPAEGAVERSCPGDKDDEGERSDNEELFAVHGSFIFAAGTGCCFVFGLRISRSWTTGRRRASGLCDPQAVRTQPRPMPLRDAS